MSNTRQTKFATRAALATLIGLLVGALAQAQTFTTLYNFTGGTDGGIPQDGVVEDKASNLYGTAEYSSPGDGVVFQVSSSGTETVLYRFSNGSDGGYPLGAVIRGKTGNLYGTTESGGDSSCNCGVVFMIDTSGKEFVLHSFVGGTSDGCYPAGGLATDRYGSLYGTTTSCGANNQGIVFTVDKKGTYTLLHSFGGGASDGAYPELTSPVLDRQSNIYGVTSGGGAAGYGVVYKLAKKRITVLHSFTGTDGCDPEGTPAIDKAGNLYGTTNGNGCSSYGTVWKVSQKRGETILHRFAGGTSDGCYPNGGLARDSKGNLYGSTDQCGAQNCGTLWELSGRTRTLLHSFVGSDGKYPNGDLLLDSKGGLYGTTNRGGTYDYGTVWAYK